MAAVTNTIKYLLWAPTDITTPDMTLYLAHPSASLPSTSTGTRVIEGTWTVDANQVPWHTYKDMVEHVNLIAGPSNAPISPTNVQNLFREMTGVAHLDLTNLDVSNATTFYAMFYQCVSLASLDISNWNTSSVTV